jgi:5-methylcytosine-specific restriction endonuclease McrA
MKRKNPQIHPDFNLPGRSKLTGRKSTLTGLFFNSITPILVPSMEEVDAALNVLGMTRGACVCAYCGGQKSEWDHFRAIVLNREPTGYITEIANLVPSCGKCNQSKGNKPWRDWIKGAAKQSPTQRAIPDLDERIRRLEAFEIWRAPIKLDYSDILGPDRWQSHLSNLELTINCLEKAEAQADACRQLVDGHLAVKRLS